MKRLDDAIASGDPIHAIIRNTGINQDGKTQGIAVPSSKAQYELINNLYASAKIDPHTVSYVEAHGTGTEVGDTAELDSISRAFYGCNDRQGPLYVGSVKSNIGHLESCSGLASLIKVVLALQNCVIPPSINFEEPKKSLSGHLSRLIVSTSPYSSPDSVRIDGFLLGTSSECTLAKDLSSSNSICFREQLRIWRDKCPLYLGVVRYPWLRR